MYNNIFYWYYYQSVSFSSQKYLIGQVVTLEKLEQAKEIYDAQLGPGLFNYEGWKHILDKHCGQLPLRIKAVPEGSVIPYKNGKCMQISKWK